MEGKSAFYTGKIGTPLNNISELPLLTLEDFILPTTECHPQASVDVMDTLYDFEEGKAKANTSVLDLTLYDSPSLADLDGSTELSFDIKELIEQSLQSQGNVVGSSSPSQLFPELLRTETSPNTSQVVNNTATGEQAFDILQNSSVNGIQDLGSMPHIVLETDQSGQAVLFVKTEQDTSAAEEFEEQVFSVPPSPAPSSVCSERSNYKAKPPSKRRQLEKGSTEYTQKRERNNIAVRKSRDKAKKRQKETEEKVKVLTAQNDDLQKKVDLLTKELNVLKGLFANVGAALPKEYKQYIAKTVNRT